MKTEDQLVAKLEMCVKELEAINKVEVPSVETIAQKTFFLGAMTAIEYALGREAECRKEFERLVGGI